MIERTEVKLAGKQRAGLDVTEEKLLLNDLHEILSERSEKKEGETL